MVVLLHVLIALSSIIYSALLFFKPSKTKFYVSYAMIGATLLSGTYLVWSTHSPLLPACMMGLIYLGFVSAVIISAHARFANGEISKE